MYGRKKNIMFLHELNCGLFHQSDALQDIFEAVNRTLRNSPCIFVSNIYHMNVNMNYT